MTDFFGTASNDYFGPGEGTDEADNYDLGDGNDFVHASLGADTYNGGAGFDSVSYRFAAEGVVLSLLNGGTGGMATGHTYIGIERVFGSNFDDTISGAAGNEFLYGGLGADTLNGEGGNDRLFGGDGNDIINGGEGNDFIEGGAGADFINGGNGIDTVGFSTFVPVQDSGDDQTNTEGVTVDLNTPPPQAEPLDGTLSNDAEGDFYINVENISGSLFDDTLRGNDDANVINGRAGNDSIVGRDGNDLLFGGAGDDFISGGNGNDNLQGGTGDDEIFAGEGNDRIFLGDGEDLALGGDGNDFFFLTNDGVRDEVYGGDTDFEGTTTDNGFDTVSYIQATAGVEVFLGGIIPFRPTEPDTIETLDVDLDMAVSEPDTLVDIERVFGSNFDDAIFGGFGDEVIFGGNGDDILAGGSGRDRLIGGNGADTFQFNIGFGDTVSVLDFEQGVDTITFFTSDETLTEADVLALVVDYGRGHVFEFGFTIDGPPVEQRFAVVSDDPDFALTVDDFTIELIDTLLPPPPFVREPLAEDFTEQDFANIDMAEFAVDALI